MRFWLWCSCLVVVVVVVAYPCQRSGDTTTTTTTTSPPLVVVVPSTVVAPVPTVTVPSVPSVSTDRPTPPKGVTVLTDGIDWDALAWCEARGNWSVNSGNGFGGGLQFAHSESWSSWVSYGGREFAVHPWDASREEQIVVGQRILVDVGWRAWPACSRKLGWS